MQCDFFLIFKGSSALLQIPCICQLTCQPLFPCLKVTNYRLENHLSTKTICLHNSIRHQRSKLRQGKTYTRVSKLRNYKYHSFSTYACLQTLQLSLLSLPMMVIFFTLYTISSKGILYVRRKCKMCVTYLVSSDNYMTYIIEYLF